MRIDQQRDWRFLRLLIPGRCSFLSVFLPACPHGTSKPLQIGIKASGHLIRHARPFILHMTESYLTRCLFRKIVLRIGRLAGIPRDPFSGARATKLWSILEIPVKETAEDSPGLTLTWERR